MTQALDQKHTIEEDILREQVKEVCNHITSGVAEMKYKYGAKFTLPSGWQKDLEWTGYKLPLVSMTQAKQNTTHHHKVMESIVSLTPRIDPAYDNVFAEKTLNSRYVRGDRELYQQSAMNKTYRRTSRPTSTANIIIALGVVMVLLAQMVVLLMNLHLQWWWTNSLPGTNSRPPLNLSKTITVKQ